MRSRDPPVNKPGPGKTVRSKYCLAERNHHRTSDGCRRDWSSCRLMIHSAVFDMEISRQAGCDFISKNGFSLPGRNALATRSFPTIHTLPSAVLVTRLGSTDESRSRRRSQRIIFNVPELKLTVQVQERQFARHRLSR